jgi:hypothetical protein
VISNYAVRVRLRGAVPVARGANYELWRPTDTPRLALFVGGLYADRWLAHAGEIKVWPAHGDRLRGTLRLRLWLPQRTERTVLDLEAPGLKQKVAVLPAGKRTLVIPVESRGPWTLRFLTRRPGYLGDGRVISVKAAMPVFTPAG